MIDTAKAPRGATAALQQVVDDLGELATDAKHAEAAARRRAQRARRIQERLVDEARRLGFQLVISHGHSPDRSTDR